MSKCHSLPGIARVGYLPCSSVPRDIPYRAVAGIRFSVNSQATYISLAGEAVCEVEEQTENNVQIEKTKLTFVSLDVVPTHLPLAFIIKTADNESYIIGSQERPHPTVKVNRYTGQTGGDPSVRKYEVSFTARKSLVRIF
jgi:hypothetical protein